MFITPEQFVARLGYAELLLYSTDYSDDPDFTNVDIKNLIRAKDYNLFPKFESNTEEDLIAGIPDRNIFLTDKVKIDGQINIQLSTYNHNQLEYFIGCLYEHMRTAWAGVKSDGTLVSPLDDRLSSHPWFSLGSAYHGIFRQCMVDKFEISISKGNQPIDLSFGIVATDYDPASAFTMRGLESLTNSPEFLAKHRRVIYGRDCQILSGTTGVIGHFGLNDASNSVFAEGSAKPGTSTYITNFSISFENNLEPVYTMKSTNFNDYRSRFNENVFPSSYVPKSPRRVSGQIEWYGNVDAYTFYEKLTGPASIQNRESLIVDCGPLKIEIKNPVWSLSEKPVGIDEIKRVARFSAATDSELTIPYYESNYS